MILRALQQQYDCSGIYLTLEKENHRAVHIYEKFGFRATGEQDEGEDIYYLPLDQFNH